MSQPRAAKTPLLRIVVNLLDNTPYNKLNIWHNVVHLLCNKFTTHRRQHSFGSRISASAFRKFQKQNVNVKKQCCNFRCQWKTQ